MTYTKILWSLIGFIFLVDTVWVSLGSFQFYYNLKDLFLQFLFLCSLFLPYVFYKTFRPDPRIVSLLESIVFLFTLITAMLVLSYLVATLRFPLIDAQLVAIDEAFGIKVPALDFWFRNHLEWRRLFVYIYNAYLIQFPLIIFYFSFFDKVTVLQRFLMQVMIAALLTNFISGILPASGPYTWYGYTPNKELALALKQLLLLRENIVDIRTTSGIVTFPSFHSIMALLYTYTFRNEPKYIFIPILLLNLLVIFACIPIGEHYFADILGAVPIFFIAIGCERLLFFYTTSDSNQELRRNNYK
ncbi:MAG TPA: phosphatase PAP2 family protein [Alphaproteobacteria bacterium]|nr:phosphatase PAP2 family protein [Alphaproteobacteria bacterium]